MHWTSIFFLVIHNLASLPLYSVIYKHISKKPLVSITVIDFIYRDLFIYVYFLSLTYAVAVSHCLVELENGVALNYFFSVLYSTIIEVLVFCVSSSLIMSGGLRLLTLITNSESKGLQLLGSENIAIVKIRGISILLSVAMEGTVILYFNTRSGLFSLMHDVETVSNLQSLRSDHYKALFSVLPVLAILVNLSAKMYTSWINWKMDRSFEIVTSLNEDQHTNNYSNEELFSVSLGAAVGFPLWMMMSIVTSFASRELRLQIFVPIQVMMVNLLFPIYIISKNRKMRSYANASLLRPVQELFNKVLTTIKMQISNNVTPTYVLPH